MANEVLNLREFQHMYLFDCIALQFPRDTDIKFPVVKTW